MTTVPTPDPLDRSTVVVPGCDAPLVSVLVLGFRHPRIADAIRAVVQGTRDLGIEVLVLLNGASDDVRAEVETRLEGVRVFSSAGNLGFGGGMNLLAGQARGEFIAFLNDDALPHAGWLQALLDCSALPDVGIATSKILFPNGTLQEAGGRMIRGGHPYQVGWQEPDTDPALQLRRVIDYGSAAAMVIRREIFEMVGGFDEFYYPAYFEDVDLALRVRRAGWLVMFEPDAVVTHSQWGSSTAPERDIAYRFNQIVFEQRWAPMFELAPERWDALDQTAPLPDSVPVTEISRRGPEVSIARYLAWLVNLVGETEHKLDSVEHRLAAKDLDLVEAQRQLGVRADLLTAAAAELSASQQIAQEGRSRLLEAEHRSADLAQRGLAMTAAADERDRQHREQLSRADVEITRLRIQQEVAVEPVAARPPMGRRIAGVVLSRAVPVARRARQAARRLR